MISATVPQRARGIRAVDAYRDRLDVEPLDQRGVDHIGPSDYRDDLTFIEQGKGRAETIGGAVGFEQLGRVARRPLRFGRSEDPRRPTTARRRTVWCASN